jgi:hypothetical protein
MASYFNLGTDEKPRWVNLDNVSVTFSKKTKPPGKSEVRFQDNWGRGEVVFGEQADRLLAQLEIHPKPGPVAGL